MMAGTRVLGLVDLCTSLTKGTQSLGGIPEVEIGSVVIDSRKVQPGGLFVALVGECQDGHDFVADAIANGAAAVLVERPLDPDAPRMIDTDGLQVSRSGGAWCLRVPNSILALQQAAAYWRRQHDVRVVGVTGSVGKTTSKEAIEAVLRTRFRTLKSVASYNNEIGLPLTLLHLTSVHERVVLEMGMYALGEITQLAEIALPHVGVVTNVGPTHLERLGTIERIAEAKAELPRALPPEDSGGVAILNGDDDRVRAMAGQTRARVFTYGLGQDSDLWADEIESRGLDGVHFRLRHREDAAYARVPSLGRHSVHTALCAAAVGLTEGMSLTEIVAGLLTQSEQLRLLAIPGPAGSTILDDTYNSSPRSCIAALSLLAELDGRKVAIFGGMLELGPYEREGHEIVGRRTGDIVDVLITVGDLAKMIGEGALDAGMPAESVFSVPTNVEATQLAKALASKGDVLLVKGSRGMHMEEIVAALARPESESNLLTEEPSC